MNKTRRNVCLVLIFAFSLFFSLRSSDSLALSSAKKKFFGQNNIIFYDPCDNGISDPELERVTATIQGNSVAEKIVNGLSGFMSVQNAKGVLAALQIARPNLNPLEHGGSFFGSFSFEDKKSTAAKIWSDEEIQSVLNAYYDSADSFQGKLLGGDVMMSHEEINRLIAVEIYYFYNSGLLKEISEINNGSSSSADDAIRADALESAKKICQSLGASCSDSELSAKIDVLLGDNPFSDSGESSEDLSFEDLFEGDDGLEDFDADSDTSPISIELSKKGVNTTGSDVLIVGDSSLPSASDLNYGRLKSAKIKSFSSFADFLGAVQNDVSGLSRSEYRHLVLVFESYGDLATLKNLLASAAPSLKLYAVAGSETSLDSAFTKIDPGSSVASSLQDFFQKLASESYSEGEEGLETASSCDRNLLGEHYDESGDGDSDGSDGGEVNPPVSGGEILAKLSSGYWYNQADSRWKNIMFSACNSEAPAGSGTLGCSGCSVTSFASAVSLLYNAKITPAKMVEYTGKYRKTASTPKDIFAEMAKNLKNSTNYKVSVSELNPTDASKITAELNKGNMIMFNCKGKNVPCRAPSYSGRGTGGHWFAIVGIEEKNGQTKWIISNPGWDYFKTHLEYTPSEVMGVKKDNAYVVSRDN